ncbi:MAG: Ig-like domain repeat protein [Acidobacteriaceae bacterium]
MLTKSYTSLRRMSAYALTLLLFLVAYGQGAAAQATTPLVTASFPQGLTPPTGLGTVFQTALDTYGDLLVVDFANGALYEYPANGGAVVTLVAAGGLPTYANPGIAIDSTNNLYIEANYNNCLLKFSYDTSTSSWDGLSTVTPANPTTSVCPNNGGGTSPYIFAQYGITGLPNGYFQPWAITTDANNNLIINAQNSGNFIFSLAVTGSGSTAKAGTAVGILAAMGARAQSIAVDKFGNIYFVEEADTATSTPPESPLPGVLMIPAGSTAIASDAGLTRVDPNLPSVRGVTTDAEGNLYISDSTEGVFFVPNPSGTPNTAGAVLLTPVPADGQVSVDQTRDILYVPTNQSGSQSITKVTFNAATLGSTATGAPAASSEAVQFSFSGAVTPASFAIQESGAATPDFTIATGGTCAGGTAYAADSGCSENVTLSPTAAGTVSAKLLMLDASNNVLSSMTLQGIGLGSALQVTSQVPPATPTVIGAGLKTPSQIAVDANDNTYVADSGLGAVEMYPKGYGAVAAATTVGTGLTAPTGVAADGAGDVFIADSGNVYEVPIGASGLNTAGQITIKGGLGANLRLAADGSDDLYISDPDNHRVVELGDVGGTFGPLSQTETDLGGFNAPSALAVDENGNLYVADGANLYEVTPAGTQTTLLTTLSNATGLAVDPSGAVYIAMPGGTIRVPNEGGTLNPADQTIVAPGVTSPASVALDSMQDVYVTDAVAENVNSVSSSASINFGTLTSATATATGNVSVVNDGNAPFNFTGFTSTADYSATTTTCTSPEAVGATCGATITFNPGPGDQGTLSAELLVQTGAANSPVGVNVVGVGVALANSTTKISVTNPTVDGTPALVTVTPSSGTGAAPTGQVTLTITGTTLTAPVVVTGTLANGTVTITPPQIPAGTYTFSVSYGGDRAYGKSTASAQVTVAVGAVTVIQPTLAAVQLAAPTYPYVLAGGTGSQEPYDGSVVPFEYTYPVQVVATDGAPLIGQPVYDPTGKLIGMNYGSVTFAGASTPGCQPVPVAADGTAPFQTTCFAIDTSNNSIPDLLTAYTITPMYSPAGTGSAVGYTNPNYSAASGSAISFTALRNPVVQISSNPSSLSVTSGSTTTATLTLTSLLGFGYAGGGDTAPTATVQEPNGGLLNNYSLPVQLACDGLPAYATCTFTYPNPDVSDPQSVAVGPPPGTLIGGTACAVNVGCVGPGTVMLTITTNVGSGAVSSVRSKTSALTFASMFGLGLLGLAFGRKKSLRGRISLLACLLLCCGVFAGISGCSTKVLGTTSGTVTPAGTYQVLITAKQVGSRTVPVTPGNPAGIVYGNENQMSLPFTVNVTVQ